MSRLRTRITEAVPARRVQQIRYVGWAGVDVLDRLRGRTDPELPPKRLRDWIGNGDFRAIGNEMVGYCREFAALEPSDRVLDIGSGIGRVAIPLTDYLDERGSYDGVEIVQKGVTWCQENITPRHPRFRFHHADIHNITYNEHGTVRGEDYRFPFEDGSFDFAILTSVFTHLLPATVERYVSELGRLLSPGGRVMGTWFLLNEQSEKGLAEGRSTFTMRHTYEIARTENARAPEDAIAYPEEHVRELFARNGMAIREPIHFGTWSGAASRIYQDIVVVEKLDAQEAPLT